ncbi:hypothetical protein HPB49_007627 [Dermacentor silvarum]|uniref:Uncharacterized protein n=2 Tax=Dermacentor silvarum TaxID=543639 RepID=A0ACB8DN35_DERSI|nr:uncharacterized protein LOC119431757 [Dermacentor silvarum]XP_037555155.1 uncharacterized protein LOC119431758 [Dermacentor silvarum]XP_037555576.1 uncharacterized protein LOC119432483 [Dermacentor silvarum]XP_049514216.1 uncharacterized protein LOC125941276 [Dermacentor silvarum]KAH7973946.1 hypothetical protein HPB49_007626 [Dermacentor silvarum]KAH7973947.1 hypothetical protein HPB49_007627 [Dermacentor silvarum]
MEDGPPKDEQASAVRKRGPPFKNRNEPRKKNNRVSDIDRARIVDASRRGGNLKQLAATLGINVKTARSIAATDREVSLKTGGSVRKFGADVVAFVTRTVDENPTYTLKQIKRTVEEEMPGLTISTTSIDRLLDAHTYSVKLATQRPVDRNRSDVKSKRKEYAQWLQTNGPRVCRFYIDETNYNIWCSRKFGRAKKGMAALQTTTSTKGANINIIACMSANGVLHWRIVERVHWIVFNEFLADVSAQVDSEEPETEAVFIFDNAPAHNRAEQANLVSSNHCIKRLPPYSPFFNPIEEVFSKFKCQVKEYLRERRDSVLVTPQGVTQKEHRRSLLVNAAQHAMPLVQRVDCAAFDRHNFSFVEAALREEDM